MGVQLTLAKSRHHPLPTTLYVLTLHINASLLLYQTRIRMQAQLLFSLEAFWTAPAASYYRRQRLNELRN